MKEKQKNDLKLIKEDIVEDNYWNDTFWGMCKGKGNNILGKILMNIIHNGAFFGKYCWLI